MGTISFKSIKVKINKNLKMIYQKKPKKNLNKTRILNYKKIMIEKKMMMKKKKMRKKKKKKELNKNKKNIQTEKKVTQTFQNLRRSRKMMTGVH